MTNMRKWCAENNIDEVECVVADINGMARGKVIPTEKFLQGAEKDTHRLPESVFVQTVTGDYPADDVSVVPVTDIDMTMRADPQTIRPVPWYDNPTAQVICDCFYADNAPVDIAPRQILKNAIEKFSDRGWQPIVAPELEFYFVENTSDPDTPLRPPVGQSGRAEAGRQSFGIDAVSEFDPVINDIYDYCELQGIDADTVAHELGAAQIEINLMHGDALSLADQTFMFKRTVRQTAIQHGMLATFMARPMQNEPGSSMHIHQSLLDIETGENVFCNDAGEESSIFRHFLGGLQKYGPAAILLFAPNVNSYRRFFYPEAPINVLWGRDNRSCGLRVPNSSPRNRRVETRLIGADANPYLAIAASLFCGYLGISEQLEPTAEETGIAYGRGPKIPPYLMQAIVALEQSDALRDIFGDRFIRAFCETKRVEFENYYTVVSSWEREHLLLHV